MEHKFNQEELAQLADSADTAGAFNELMKPGTLVIYEGGGYDGCIWEWNTFVVTAPDTIVEIHSSGRKGVWAQGFGYFEQGRQKRQFNMDNFIHVLHGHDMSADLGTQAGRREINSFIGCYALAVARKLEDLDLGYNVELQCCECGKHFDSTEEFLLDHGYDRGDGGVGVVNDHLVCGTCYNSTICSECGERYEEGTETRTPGGCYCEWCVKQAVRRFEEADMEEYEELEASIEQVERDTRRMCELAPAGAEKYKDQCRAICYELTERKGTIIDRYI